MGTPEKSSLEVFAAQPTTQRDEAYSPETVTTGRAPV
jgi:hypothetical protein